MAAPPGNQFWKLRSKHGRDKLFASPELLWEAACEYFQWCVDNPWIKVEQTKLPPKPIKDDQGKVIGFTPNTVEIPTARPFTLKGLCLYVHCNESWFRNFRASQQPNKEDGKKVAKQKEDFTAVLTRIEETIFTNKFEGAAVGAYNATIIARDLGLADKTDNHNTTDYSITLDLT